MFRILLSLALPVSLLMAQGPGDPPGRNRIQARLHDVRMERLRQSLGIPQEKAKAIADRWTRYDLESRDLRLRGRRLRQEIGAILLSSVPETEKDARIGPLMEEVSELRQRQHALQQAFEDEIRASLSPAQQGRFMLLAEELQRALMKALRHPESGTTNPP